MKKGFLRCIVLLLGICLVFTSFACGEKDETPDTPTETTYTVIFDSNGGTAVAQQTVKEGEKAVKPTDPVKISTDASIIYEFKEWRLNGVAFDFNMAITNDMTLVAYYESEPAENTYTVTFDSNGGTAIPQQTVKEGEKAVKPINPIKDSTDSKIQYEFKEWRLNGVAFDFNTPITESITLVAEFSIWGGIV